MRLKLLLSFTLISGLIFIHAQEVELLMNIGDEEDFSDTYSYVPSSRPRQLKAIGDLLFFTAEDGHKPSSIRVGRELWVTDGTIEGTHLVKEIIPSTSTSIYSEPSEFIEYNGTLMFAAGDISNYNSREFRELYISDGTAEGTHMLTKFNTDSSRQSSPHSLVDYGDRVLLVATDDFWEYLFVTDGTAEGTQRLDILPDTVRLSVQRDQGTLLFSDSLIFFNAHNYSNGTEPWVSDGTPEGTRLLKDLYTDLDIADNPGSSEPKYYTKMGQYVYFSARANNDGFELWRTDGTTEGTQLVKNINESARHGSGPHSFNVINDKLYFVAIGSEEGTLWKSDGTEAGTVLLEGIFPQSLNSQGMKAIGDSLYFGMRDDDGRINLWISDGTELGTRMINTDHLAVDYSLSPEYFEEWKGEVYFAANDSMKGKEIFKTDGTEEGTMLAVDVMHDISSNPRQFYSYGDQVMFTTTNSNNSWKVWLTDGTREGTDSISNLIPGINIGKVSIGDYYYFEAKESINGPAGLWKTDGTPDGTMLLREFAQISMIRQHNEHIFIYAMDLEHGSQIWKSDGTTEGTTIAFNENPETEQFQVSDIASSGNRLFISAAIDSVGTELYVADRSLTHLDLVKDIAPGHSNSVPLILYDVGGLLFFAANDNVHGYEMWRSDGTEDGTYMLKDIYPGTGQGIGSAFLADVDCNLIFIGNTPDEGGAYWKTDGTREGTVKLENMVPDPNERPPGNPVRKQDHFYFSTRSFEHGLEIWKSDGTAEGTSVVLSGGVLPSKYNDLNAIFGIAGHRLVFSGYTQELGMEPYVTTIDTFKCADNPVLVTATTEISPASCAAASDGVAEIVLEGGTCGYSYSMDGKIYTFGSKKEEDVGIIRLPGLSTGETQVYIRDENECMATTTVTIAAREALAISETVSQPNEESSTGSISLDVSGGTAPYRYSWTNGDSTSTVTNLEPGDHTVNVTDTAGCMTELTFTIEEFTTGYRDAFAGKLNIYPNPVNDVLNIQLPPGTENGRVQIFDPYARMVHDVEVSAVPGEIFKIDLTDTRYPAGIYMVRFFTEEDPVQTSSFIKE